MNNQFDREFAKMLQTSEFALPDSYETRFQETLNQISVMAPKRYFLLFHSKIAAVIAICSVSISISVGVGAAISIYQQRLSALSETQVEKYNSDVQNVYVEADGFSRPLLQEEQKRMEELHDAYRASKQFPEGEIVQVQKLEDVMQGKLCFCTENSTFYLPENTLTDEDLLQIIDFMEKRDYSVQKENKSSDVAMSATEKVSEAEAIELAKQVITSMYQVNTEDVKIKVELDDTKNSVGEKLSSYLIDMSNKDWAFDIGVEIDSQSGMIWGIDIDSKEKEHCVPGFKVDESQYRAYQSKVEKACQALLGDSDIEKIWMSYNYVEDNTLNRGNIKYVVESGEGRGYAFLYSINTDMIYSIYYIPDCAVFMKQEKSNAKQNEKEGVKRKQMVLN